LVTPSAISDANDVVGSYQNSHGKAIAFLAAYPRPIIPRPIYIKEPIPRPSPIQVATAQMWGAIYSIQSPEARWAAVSRLADVISRATEAERNLQ
jgi:hypothetical protein